MALVVPQIEGGQNVAMQERWRRDDSRRCRVGEEIDRTRDGDPWTGRL